MATEHERRAQLNADRNRREARLERLGGDSQSDINEQFASVGGGELVQKNRLALFKASAQQKLNQQAGAYAGASAGASVGSFIPFIGTAIGAFIGRYIGKKLGATGIVIASVVLLLIFGFFATILFLILIKGYCDWENISLYKTAARVFDALFVGVCKSLG